MSTIKMYRVFWEYKDGTKKGNGEPLTYKDAKSWADSLNKKHDHIHYWII